jgi:hypothetical protein
MMENKFSNSEPTMTLADLETLESAIGARLPRSFREHYTKYNGGVPERAYWVSGERDEPLEVAAFKSISDAPSNLLLTYQTMVKKQVIPCHLLPFANDWGGSFFCLNVDSGSVSYFTTDNFRSELSMQENQAEAEEIICTNFVRFVQCLVGEAD